MIGIFIPPWAGNQPTNQPILSLPNTTVTLMSPSLDPTHYDHFPNNRFEEVPKLTPKQIEALDMFGMQ